MVVNRWSLFASGRTGGRTGGESSVELVDRARPVLLQETGQCTVGEQSSLSLAARAIVRFVARIPNPLNRTRANRTRLPVATVNRHPLAESSDLFRKAVPRGLTKTLDPLEERLTSRVEKCRYLVIGQTARQPQRRQAGAVKELVGVRVSDSAEQGRICECALESMVLAQQARREVLQ